MGTKLTKSASTSDRDAANTQARLSPDRLSMPSVPWISWLDHATAAGVVDIVQSLAVEHPEAYAIILFGSVARREERPLDERDPSDVDLLLLFDAAVLNPAAQELTRGQ